MLGLSNDLLLCTENSNESQTFLLKESHIENDRFYLAKG